MNVKLLSICIVIYNKEIDQSNTVLSLSKMDFDKSKIKLVIYNNDTRLCIKDKFNILNNFDFDIYNNDENIALSSLYNKFITEYDSDYYMFIDDDTIIDKKFLKIFDESHSEDERLYIPKVIVNNKLYSPRYQSLVTNLFTKKNIRYLNNDVTGSVSSDGMFAITSGIIVCKSVFIKGVKFDENLKFYGIDSKFLYDFSKLFKTSYVLPIHLNHDLSYLSKSESLELKVWRFYQRYNSSLYLLKYSGGKLNFIFNKWFMILKAIYFNFKYRTFSFTRVIRK